jgi:DNA-directed RNA polymerase sigma subunit (sigma70/sigma32)
MGGMCLLGREPDDLQRPVPMTYEAIAEKLGCSMQLVQQIEKRALKKLRKVWLARYGSPR